MSGKVINWLFQFQWYRVLKWFLFSVILSLMPLAFDWIIALAGSPSGVVPGIVKIIGKGELCLISVTLSGVALGEMYLAKTQSRAAGMIAFFINIINFGHGTTAYIAMKSLSFGSPNPLLVTLSIILLITTIVVATATVAMTGGNDV